MVPFKYLYVILFLNVASSRSEKDNINDLVDMVLQGAKDSILSKNNGQLGIPDMEKPYSKKISSFIRISGGVKATEGVFKNLASLERTGDAILDLSDKVAKLRLNLGLKDMEIYFNHCRVWVNKIFSMSQTLKATVKSNSIDGQISVFDDGVNCKTTLDEIRITRFDDIDIDIKVKGGPGFLNGILEKLGDWIVDHFKSRIKEAVEKELKEHISKVLQKYNLCDILK